MKNVVLEGDVRDRLKEIPDASVQCIVTSPPYWGLRDYGTDTQIGLEATLHGYVETLRSVFQEVRRVLRDDGVVWLNLGDAYATKPPGGNCGLSSKLTNPARQNGLWSESRGWKPTDPSLKSKDLLGIPWRVAFALQDDGWYLRADNVWSKPNPMPESVTDRPTKSHEYVFLLTKNARYYYDAEAVREPVVSSPSDVRKMREQKARIGGKTLTAGDLRYKAHSGTNIGKKRGVGDPDAGRNLRSVWTITTTPFPGTHFAVFPEALPERCIRAGTSEHGACGTCGAPFRRVKTAVGWEPTCDHADESPAPCVVLDPFAGSGTTLRVARRLGRDFIGIELNPEYAEMARERAFSVAVPLTRFQAAEVDA